MYIVLHLNIISLESRSSVWGAIAIIIRSKLSNPHPYIQYVHQYVRIFERKPKQNFHIPVQYKIFALHCYLLKMQATSTEHEDIYSQAQYITNWIPKMKGNRLIFEGNILNIEP